MTSRVEGELVKITSERRVAEIMCASGVGYYDNFPPKSFNVSVESREATGTQGARKVLVVNKDFKAGDIIYKVRSQNCHGSAILILSPGTPNRHSA